MKINVPKKIIDELISRTEIVSIINKKIPLKKQGSNFVACCPFHTETHPSFTVNYKKQFYYCFSCGAHGNVINFLMNYDQLTFIECVKKLINIHGIKTQQFVHTTNNFLNTKKHHLYQFMNKLCIYYQDNLKNKKYLQIYKYLINRGLTHNSILNFRIGFAPEGWNNITKNLQSTLYNTKLIYQSGMIINNQKNQYDRFRNRIMFPMKDESGKIIAFGGRIAHNQSNIPKYINSPDTEIFKKTQCLYGFYEILKNSKNVPYILLVEGYIDVIILTQFGINYVVASLGTHITNKHIQLIYKITNKIICCYDGDSAGKKAAWNTLNTVLSYLNDDREIHFMFLPNSEDPDTLIRKIGKYNFLKKISEAKNLSYFLFETLSKKVNLQTLEGRVKLSKLAIPMLNKIPGKILKLCLRQELGNRIGILDENKLNQLISIKKSNQIFNIKKEHKIQYNIEHILIGLLIQHPKFAKLVPIAKEIKKYIKNNKILMFIDLVEICKSHPIFTTNQLIQYYQQNNKNNFPMNLETLANWNHMIPNDILEDTFIEVLIKLYNLILEQRQNTLITQERTTGLTIKERQELWRLNQTLSVR